MSLVAHAGRRKAALLLASLPAGERQRLMAGLPPAISRELDRLMADLRHRGLLHREVIEKVLAEDLRGLTAETTLGVEQLLALAESLPAGWFARVLTAAGPIDREFLLALLSDGYARQVRGELAGAVTLTPTVAGAILEWAMDPRRPSRCTA